MNLKSLKKKHDFLNFVDLRAKYASIYGVVIRVSIHDIISVLIYN